ncbi:MAG: hypothetical protein AAFQ36_05055 [Pseudomonadota bacterium]
MRLALAFVLAPCVAAAEPLPGPAITAALSERALTYEGGARQVFYASGRTLYDAGAPSWGYWRVEGGFYCSQWPPADGWDCYSVSEIAGGLRFTDTRGNAVDGVYQAR